MAAPPQPPRLTGVPEIDNTAMNQWFWQFYNATVLSQTAFDPNNLPDPPTSTVQQAQETANAAFTLATANKVIADANKVVTDRINTWEFGSFTVSGAVDNVAVTFTTAQVDTTYKIIASVTGITGAPAAGAHDLESIAKTTTGFTATVVTAPGAATSVTFDFILVR
jgi:hypothetical protein